MRENFSNLHHNTFHLSFFVVGYTYVVKKREKFLNLPSFVMKRAVKSPDGSFAPQKDSKIDRTVKYIRNPETGVYERNPYFDPKSAPLSSKPTQTSFDDMLKNLDDLVQRSTSPKLDFESMTESIDHLMQQNQIQGAMPTEQQKSVHLKIPDIHYGGDRMTSPDRFAGRLVSPDRENKSRSRILSPVQGRRERITSPVRERDIRTLSSERNSQILSPERSIISPEIPLHENTADSSYSRRSLSDSPRPTSEPDSPSHQQSSRAGKKTEDELLEQERQEMEKQIRDLNRVNAEKKAANRREAEMVAQERIKRTQIDRERKQRRGSTSTEFHLIASGSPDENLLVPDYVTALMTTLRNDTTVSPIPNDFLSADGFATWKTTMRRSFQEVLIKMLKYRFLQKPENEGPSSFDPVEIRFRVLCANGLRSKEGKRPKIFCFIEHGDMMLKSKKREKFETEIVESFDPVWNQSMNIQVKKISDKIVVSVYDRQKSKDYFLGQVKLALSELISQCAKSNDFEKEYVLEPVEKKEKYVAGTIRLGAFLFEQYKKSSAKSYQEIQASLTSLQIDNRALFDILLRACVVLDLFTPREGRLDLLSFESVSMLKLWAQTWLISDAYQVISHLKILFEKYQEDQVSISDLLKGFHYLYATVKHRGPFPDYEV
jgi:hypothetical protein